MRRSTQVPRRAGVLDREEEEEEEEVEEEEEEAD
jgi:hypothetical protein